MRFRDLAFLVASNLRRMKMRLMLTSLGVVIGTSAIVLMMSLGIGLQANLLAELGDIGAATNITVQGGTDSVTGEMLSMDEAAVESFSAIEHVAGVLPSKYASIGDIRYKHYAAWLNVQGVPMDAFEQFGYELESGRLARNDDEIVLGAAVPASFSFYDEDTAMATGLAPELDLVGKRLEATVYEQPTEKELAADPMAQGMQSTVKLTVVGVLAPVDSQTDNTAFVTMDAAISSIGQDPREVTYDSVIVKADSVDTVTDIETALKDQGYYTYSATSIQESLKTTFMIISGVLGALGAISMLVASLGIANTMTMSIYERTREIGIMKAVGASNKQIQRVFLSEAAVIGLVGGVGGLAISAAGASLANLFVKSLLASQYAAGSGSMETTLSFFQIPAWLALFAIAFAMGVGLLAGVLPAVRAAHLDPLTALRHE